MAENSLPFIKRIVRQALFEWVQHKYLVPIDRIFKEISSAERLGPREREACGVAIYEFIRFWNFYLPKKFDPQDSVHLHRFDVALQAVNSRSSQGEKLHVSAKPRFEDDPVSHIRKLHSLPEFLFREINTSPEGLLHWHEYLHVSLARAPLFFRLNQTISSEEENSARTLLKELGAEESAFVKRSFRFSKPVSLGSTDLIQKAWGEIHDEHSQMVAHLLNPQKGERILDLCAGAGGKTLHLADKLGNDGQIFAYDSDSRRLATMIPRMKKRSWTNITLLKEQPRNQKFDTILIDAPCSGLGTLRRSPDRLFSFSEKESERLRSIQTNLLLGAKKMLSPRGKILYVTCTPRPQENLNILATLIGDKVLRPLSLHSYLKNSPAIASSLLPKSRLTSASRITDAYLPITTKIPSDCYLALGPTEVSADVQASDALKGDAFFYALVQ